jgi:hypothetical protein
MVRAGNWGFGDKLKYRHCKLKKKTPIAMRTEAVEGVMAVQLLSLLNLETGYTPAALLPGKSSPYLYNRRLV